MVNALEKAADALKTLNRYIDLLSGWVLNFACAVIFAIIVISVFFRYVIGDSIIWGEEAAKFTLVWMCFIGASAVMIRGGHMGITFFYDRAKGVTKIILVLFTELVLLSTLLALLWYGVDLTISAWPQVSTAIPWLSIGVVYIAMPLGALLMIPVSLELLLRNLSASLKWNK